MRIDLDREQYPNTSHVAAMLDCIVMQDLSGGEDEGPATGTVVRLGQEEDQAAGLRTFCATPFFATMDELEQFCSENRAQFDDLSRLEQFPDHLFWEPAGA